MFKLQLEGIITKIVFEQVKGDGLELFSLLEYLALLVVQLFAYCWCASEVTKQVNRCYVTVPFVFIAGR
jgi:hypothetical protein